MTTRLPPDAYAIDEGLDTLVRQRDAARREAAAWQRLMTSDSPIIALAARWPGYVTCGGLGVLAGMLLADVWGVW